jgi:hypothetical protein
MYLSNGMVVFYSVGFDGRMFDKGQFRPHSFPILILLNCRVRGPGSFRSFADLQKCLLTWARHSGAGHFVMPRCRILLLLEELQFAGALNSAALPPITSNFTDQWFWLSFTLTNSIIHLAGVEERDLQEISGFWKT